MYPRIPCELVADPLCSAGHCLWTNAPTHRCINPGAQVARATKFCSVVLNICGPPSRNSIHITTLLAPRIFSWHLYFLESVCTPAPTTRKKNPFPYGETLRPTVLSVTQCAALQPAGNYRLSNAYRAVDCIQWRRCWADCVESRMQDRQCTYVVTYR
jgi:hypothetical protein